jgi:hypothetical protein
MHKLKLNPNKMHNKLDIDSIFSHVKGIKGSICHSTGNCIIPNHIIDLYGNGITVLSIDMANV